MATPVGHSLAGLAVSRLVPAATAAERRALTLLCVVMANLPDLDLLPGLLVGRPAAYHQGVTHSLGLAVLVSVAAALVARPVRRSATAVFGICLAAYSTHMLLDLFGPDARYPFGIPLLWPLSSSAFLSPFQLLLGVHHAGGTSEPTSTWLRNLLDTRNLLAIALEIAVVSPWVLLAELAGRRRR